jgi:hypothetical protein
MNKFSVIEYRGFNDFKFGSFTVYVTDKVIIIRGVLKKTNSPSLYLKIRRCI